MKVNASLKGTEEVRRNLVRVMGRKRVASMAGLIKAAAFIRRDMDMTPPLIPVDTGVLRASWYATPIFGTNGQPMIVMGFTAKHAVFAHDIDWQQGKRPGSGPKFFQSALNRNRHRVTKIIGAEMLKR
jgi:hypothetical protein